MPERLSSCYLRQTQNSWILQCKGNGNGFGITAETHDGELYHPYLPLEHELVGTAQAISRTVPDGILLAPSLESSLGLESSLLVNSRGQV